MAGLHDDVRTFVREYLPSIAHANAALLLMKYPTRAWTVAEVSSVLGTPPDVTASHLSLLATSGLLTCRSVSSPRYRYVVSEDAEDRLLRELAALQAADRASLAELFEERPRKLMQRLAESLRLTR